jgi:hypothetical protein
MLGIFIDKTLTLQTNHTLLSHHYSNVELLTIFNHLFISYLVNRICVELLMLLFYYTYAYDLSLYFELSHFCLVSLISSNLFYFMNL